MGCSTIAYLLDSGRVRVNLSSDVSLIELSIPSRGRQLVDTRIRPNDADLKLERHVRSRRSRPVVGNCHRRGGKQELSLLPSMLGQGQQQVSNCLDQSQYTYRIVSNFIVSYLSEPMAQPLRHLSNCIDHICLQQSQSREVRYLI
jgi:hypothetical protein